MTESGDDQTPNNSDLASPADDATTSSINRPWLIRIVIIAACLLGYGTWSIYDALIAYPARGAAYASWAEWQYLGNAIEADSKESPGVLRREAAVVDPVAELARLKSEEVRQRNETDLQGGSRQRRAEMEIARQTWLSSLAMIGRLDPAYTNFYRNPDQAAAAELASLEPVAANTETITGLRSRLDPIAPKARFGDLNSRWNSETPPGPLRSYDIPVNKIQAVLCFGFAGYLLFLFIRVATKTYRWDPATKSLTLPSGETIAPADLEDVDKRKWDKFIVFLRIKDAHSQLGGQEVRFDTYRHGRIEEWILSMEKAAFPDRISESDSGETAASGSDSAEAPAEQAHAG